MKYIFFIEFVRMILKQMSVFRLLTFDNNSSWPIKNQTYNFTENLRIEGMDGMTGSIPDEFQELKNLSR